MKRKVDIILITFCLFTFFEWLYGFFSLTITWEFLLAPSVFMILCFTVFERKKDSPPPSLDAPDWVRQAYLGRDIYSFPEEVFKTLLGALLGAMAGALIAAIITRDPKFTPLFLGAIIGSIIVSEILADKLFTGTLIIGTFTGSVIIGWIFGAYLGITRK